MRATITIEDSLYNKVVELADPSMTTGEIFREALKTFVRVQTGKRLIALGGAAPKMQEIPPSSRLAVMVTDVMIGASAWSAVFSGVGQVAKLPDFRR